MAEKALDLGHFTISPNNAWSFVLPIASKLSTEFSINRRVIDRMGTRANVQEIADVLKGVVDSIHGALDRDDARALQQNPFDQMARALNRTFHVYRTPGDLARIRDTREAIERALESTG